MRTLLTFLLLPGFKLCFVIELVNGGIDSQHLQMYPDCGKISFDKCFLDPGPPGSPRVAGGKTGTYPIPWLVLLNIMEAVIIKGTGKELRREEEEISICGGSILSKTSVLTAGHCICTRVGFGQDSPKSKVKDCVDGPSKNQLNSKRRILMEFNIVSSSDDGINIPADEGYVLEVINDQTIGVR